MKREDSITINAIGVREEIIRFAVAMEEEMRKKDNEYNETHRSNIRFLIDHLKEERGEVDHEITISLFLMDYINSNELVDVYNKSRRDAKTELVHEAIMCMLVKEVI